MTNTELIQALRNKKSRDNRELLDEAADVIGRLTQPAENRTGKIDCTITENFLKERERMCNHYLCSTCPLKDFKYSWHTTCVPRLTDNPAKAIAIVQAWSDEHPVKTIKDDFLEKFPNAPLNFDGTPKACPRHLGYEKECIANDCFECWNRPLSEVQK